MPTCTIWVAWVVAWGDRLVERAEAGAEDDGTEYRAGSALSWMVALSPVDVSYRGR